MGPDNVLLNHHYKQLVQYHQSISELRKKWLKKNASLVSLCTQWVQHRTDLSLFQSNEPYTSGLFPSEQNDEYYIDQFLHTQLDNHQSELQTAHKQILTTLDSLYNIYNDIKRIVDTIESNYWSLIESQCGTVHTSSSSSAATTSGPNIHSKMQAYWSNNKDNNNISTYPTLTPIPHLTTEKLGQLRQELIQCEENRVDNSIYNISIKNTNNDNNNNTENITIINIDHTQDIDHVSTLLGLESSIETTKDNSSQTLYNVYDRILPYYNEIIYNLSCELSSKISICYNIINIEPDQYSSDILDATYTLYNNNTSVSSDSTMANNNNLMITTSNSPNNGSIYTSNNMIPTISSNLHHISLSKTTTMTTSTTEGRGRGRGDETDAPAAVSPSPLPLLSPSTLLLSSDESIYTNNLLNLNTYQHSTSPQHILLSIRNLNLEPYAKHDDIISHLYYIGIILSSHIDIDGI